MMRRVMLIVVLIASFLILSSYATVPHALEDTSSVLVHDRSMILYIDGLKNRMNDPKHAIDAFNASYTAFPNMPAAEQMGALLHFIGRLPEARAWYDRAVELDRHRVHLILEHGIFYHRHGQYENALSHYQLALQFDPKNAEVLFHIGVTYQHMGRLDASADYYWRAVEINRLHVKSWLNLATLHQKYGSAEDAISIYLKGLRVFHDFWSAYRTDGRKDEDHDYVHPSQVMMESNLAAAYYQSGDYIKGMVVTKQLLQRLYTIAEAFGDSSLSWLMCGKERRDNASSSLCNVLQSSNIEMLQEMYDYNDIHESISTALSTQWKLQQSAVHWQYREEMQHALLNQTIANIHILERRQAQHNAAVEGFLVYPGPLLPFDTLMIPSSLAVRLQIARAASIFYEQMKQHAEQQQVQEQQNLIQSSEMKSLRLGFISFDFNEHPTAHLVEAIFQVLRSHQSAQKDEMKNSTIELYIFSYGKDDNSTYRENLKTLADEFIELALLSHQEAAQKIREYGIDILLDMQIHTIGSRLEISALHPADVVVNYLVFPGTGGGTFYDYIVADPIVIPAEHTHYYSEAVLMLPATYQMSGYDYMALTSSVDSNQSEAVTADSYENKTNHSIIFCNFNKIDKIDMESFSLWMRIMRRVPQSSLWLLEPTKYFDESKSKSVQLAKENILIVAQAFGVTKDRLIFAERVTKVQHILRHSGASLFLDTLVYGAHSTATDALRGGLPVLTLAGDSFPNRVATSLYNSFEKKSIVNGKNVQRVNPKKIMGAEIDLRDLMVVNTVKEFEDTAVRIAMGARSVQATNQIQSLLSSAKNKIKELIMKDEGLFNASQNVNSFVSGMEAIAEEKSLMERYKNHQMLNRSVSQKKYHLIVLKK